MLIGKTYVDSSNPKSAPDEKPTFLKKGFFKKNKGRKKALCDYEKIYQRILVEVNKLSILPILRQNIEICIFESSILARQSPFVELINTLKKEETQIAMLRERIEDILQMIKEFQVAPHLMTKKNSNLLKKSSILMTNSHQDIKKRIVSLVDSIQSEFLAKELYRENLPLSWSYQKFIEFKERLTISSNLCSVEEELFSRKQASNLSLDIKQSSSILYKNRTENKPLIEQIQLVERKDKQAQEEQEAPDCLQKSTYSILKKNFFSTEVAKRQRKQNLVQEIIAIIEQLKTGFSQVLDAYILHYEHKLQNILSSESESFFDKKDSINDSLLSLKNELESKAFFEKIKEDIQSFILSFINRDENKLSRYEKMPAMISENRVWPELIHFTTLKYKTLKNEIQNDSTDLLATNQQFIGFTELIYFFSVRFAALNKNFNSLKKELIDSQLALIILRYGTLNETGFFAVYKNLDRKYQSLVLEEENAVCLAKKIFSVLDQFKPEQICSGLNNLFALIASTDLSLPKNNPFLLFKDHLVKNIEGEPLLNFFGEHKREILSFFYNSPESKRQKYQELKGAIDLLPSEYLSIFSLKKESKLVGQIYILIETNKLLDFLRAYKKEKGSCYQLMSDFNRLIDSLHQGNKKVHLETDALQQLFFKFDHAQQQLIDSLNQLKNKNWNQERLFFKTDPQTQTMIVQFLEDINKVPVWVTPEQFSRHLSKIINSYCTKQSNRKQIDSEQEQIDSKRSENVFIIVIMAVITWFWEVIRFIFLVEPRPTLTRSLVSDFEKALLEWQAAFFYFEKGFTQYYSKTEKLPPCPALGKRNDVTLYEKKSGFFSGPSKKEKDDVVENTSLTSSIGI